MGYWGWRPLVLSVVISVWVVGCNIVSDASPSVSPSPSPRVTLTVRQLVSPTPAVVPTRVVIQPATPVDVPPPASATPFLYVIQPDDTLLGIAIRFGIEVADLEAANPDVDARALQPGQSLVIPGDTVIAMVATPLLPDLALPVPACYQTPAETVLCLGLVDNTLDYPLEQVAVDVELVTADGSSVATQQVEIEQSVIPAGSSAPYRALFDEETNDAVGARAWMTQAREAQGVDARFIMLDVEDDRLESVGGRYVISATLRNGNEEAAQDIRVIATLRDAAGNVLGYRVADVADNLDPGESAPIRLEIVTQPSGDTPSYSLYVEARRAE